MTTTVPAALEAWLAKSTNHNCRTRLLYEHRLYSCSGVTVVSLWECCLLYHDEYPIFGEGPSEGAAIVAALRQCAGMEEWFAEREEAT